MMTSPGGTLEVNVRFVSTGSHHDANPTIDETSEMVPRAKHAVPSPMTAAVTNSPTVTMQENTDSMFNGEKSFGGTTGLGPGETTSSTLSAILRKVDRRRGPW